MSPKKILIADDSWIIRSGLKNCLIGEGFEVIEAVNGKDAIEKTLSEKPDCIVLDLLMPETDGYEVLSKVKGEGLKIPIIVLSADIQETTKKNCLDLGAKVFLKKPPSPKSLIEAVKKVLN